MSAPGGVRGDLANEIAWRPFDRLASLLFAALAVVGMIAAVLALTSAQDQPFAVRLVGAGIALLTVGVHVTLVAGLGWGHAWARPAAVSILWLTAAAGVIEAIAALGRGALLVPLAGIAALVVLARRPSGHGSVRRPANVSALLVVLAWLAASTIGLGAGWALTPGNTPLAVGKDALVLSVGVACDPDATLPEAVAVDVSWRWLARDPYPGTTDGILIAWWLAAEAPVDDGWGYRYGSVDGVGDDTGRWLGAGSPSAGLLQGLGQGAGRFEIGLDAAAGGDDDGRVTLHLERDDGLEGPATLVVEAWYAHLDRWVVHGSAECVTS